MRGGTGDAEAWACRADLVGFLYFEGLLLMRSAANDKSQVCVNELYGFPATKEVRVFRCVLYPEEGVSDCLVCRRVLSSSMAFLIVHISLAGIIRGNGRTV